MLPSTQDDYYLRKLLEKVRDERGFDSDGFRPAYVARRVNTRLIATGASNIREYMRVLDADQGEWACLINALTVNVSEFFRDRTVYRFLQTKVVPEIIEHKARRSHNVLRVWSAGCSTGEEPYSVAMLFKDAVEHRKQTYSLSVTGTDIDDRVLEKARAARYPVGKLEQIPADFRSRYTIVDGDAFEIAPDVRAIVKFRHLDLFADNPIGAVDLILCRNVMIYFDRKKQSMVFERFLGALRKGGFLVIGKSEKLASGMAQAFVARSLAERVYQRPSTGEGEASGVRG